MTHETISRRRAARAIGIALVTAGLGSGAGCGKKRSLDYDTGVDGYQCLKCGEKFYVDAGTLVEFCPKCRAPRPVFVRKFGCERCQWSEVGPEVRESIPCGKCGQPTNLSLPVTQQDLDAWGARSVAAADVAAPAE